MLAFAAATFEDHVTKFSGATACYGAEHLPLLQGDLVRVLPKKRIAMLPQTVGDGWHDVDESRATSREPAPLRRFLRRHFLPEAPVADDETVRS